LADAGELALACYIAEMAALAAPKDGAIRARIYDTRAASETSLMARGAFSAAA
jgi:hypothetical protein